MTKTELLPHLERQVAKKGLVAHFFVHRSTRSLCIRGPGRHRLALTCLLIDRRTPPGFPPLVAAKGIAFCHYRDRWILDKGKELSLQRALRALKRPAITDTVRLTDHDLIDWAFDHHLLVERDGKKYIYCNRGIGFGPIRLWGPEEAFWNSTLPKEEKAATKDEEETPACPKNST